MRIAFVDLHFAWPPPGGAQVDLLNTMRGLQQLGHEVHLFGGCYDFIWLSSAFDPQQLPFPSTRVPIELSHYTPRQIGRAFQESVRPWKPDVVVVGFGRYMKPYVIHALAEFPLISRYYMYEHLCIRDFCLFRDGGICPNDFLSTPNICQSCAIGCWGRELRSGRYSPYGREYAAARVFEPSYYRTFRDAFRAIRIALVNNTLAQERLAPFCDDVRVIPGGIDIAHYPPLTRIPKGPADKKIILMSGRVDDPRKGLDVLLEAGLGLAQTRDDFEVWVTANELDYDHPWLRAVGWQDHSGVMRLYEQADIVVAPSIWAEPFGLVAVEGMAAGLPVVASNDGGLAGIVRDGETGYLFETGDRVELALRLNTLLDSPALRTSMGESGRRRVEEHYTWQHIVPDFWPAILEKAAA